jgi:hypothetical protein
MRITIRRTAVIFDTVFNDVDGEPVSPDSAVLRISYPAGEWPLDGSDRRESTLELTTDEEALQWSTIWNSGVSTPGLIFWHCEASTAGVVSAPQDGFFLLRGNLANVTFAEGSSGTDDAFSNDAFD